MILDKQLISNCKDEKQFRAMVVVPWLQSLGFTTVVDVHGTMEKGIDLIATCNDLFGNPKYHGVQTKFDRIYVGLPVDNIVSQAETAFSNYHYHLPSGEEVRICSFTVVNGKTTTPQAAEQIHIRLDKRRGNVQLYDEKSLFSIASPTMIDRFAYHRHILLGIQRKAAGNLEQLARILDPASRAGQMPRLRHEAASKYLEAAFLLDSQFSILGPKVRELHDEIDSYVEILEMINRIYLPGPYSDVEVFNDFFGRSCVEQFKRQSESIVSSLQSVIDELLP